MKKRQKMLVAAVDQLLDKIDEVMDGHASHYVHTFVGHSGIVLWEFRPPLFAALKETVLPHDLMVARAIVTALDRPKPQAQTIDSPRQLLIDEFESLAKVFSGLAAELDDDPSLGVLPPV